MDLESIKRCWREEAQAWPAQLEEGPVMQMVTNRAADLRRELRGRLRREVGYYLPTMALVAAGLVSGFALNRLLAAGSIVLLLGGIMATLWCAERRIKDTPLDRSLREVLTELGSKVDAAGRAYVAAYVAVFVATAAALIGFTWWRYGIDQRFAGAVVLGALAVVWSYRSGRGYVERMFQRYRAELAECLRQLEEQM